MSPHLGNLTYRKLVDNIRLPAHPQSRGTPIKFPSHRIRLRRHGAFAISVAASRLHVLFSEMDEVHPVMADEPIDDTLQTHPSPVTHAADATTTVELPVMTDLAIDNVATDAEQQRYDPCWPTSDEPRQTNNSGDSRAPAPPAPAPVPLSAPLPQEQQPPQQQHQQLPQQLQTFNGASPAATSGGGGNGLVSNLLSHLLSLCTALLFAVFVFHLRA